jgi:hypothetical protein
MVSMVEGCYPDKSRKHSQVTVSNPAVSVPVSGGVVVLSPVLESKYSHKIKLV